MVAPLFAEILRTHGVDPRSHTPIAMCGVCYGDLSEPCEECGSRGWVEVVEEPKDEADEEGSQR